MDRSRVRMACQRAESIRSGFTRGLLGGGGRSLLIDGGEGHPFLVTALALFEVTQADEAR
jgi:hypothetical protein